MTMGVCCCRLLRVGVDTARPEPLMGQQRSSRRLQAAQVEAAPAAHRAGHADAGSQAQLDIQPMLDSHAKLDSQARVDRDGRSRAQVLEVERSQESAALLKELRSLVATLSASNARAEQQEGKDANTGGLSCLHAVLHSCMQGTLHVQ